MDKRYWIFASSDISRKNIAELEQHKRTTWDKANGMKIGDIAFLYLTAPEKCITAQTQIVSIDDNKIEIELVKFFDPRIPLADMNSIGMAHPQGGVGSIKEKRYVDFILNYPESLKTAQQEASKHFLQGKRVWLYKPGEQGSKWELMLERGLMGIGWSKLGDLRQYKVAEEIESKLNELYPTKNGSLRLNDKPANWDMCNTINKGDIIIAVTGLNTLLGYGKVVSDYFYDESIDDEFASFRKVDWTCSGKWDIDFDRDIFKDDNVKQLPIKTLTDITKQGYPQKLLAIMWGNILDTKPTYDIPLNQILYGPPGTGKTYHTIDKALEILCERGEIDSIPQERDEKKALFNECMEQGQIGFVTFHQSYGYEDFVEGIRPRLSGENDESQISEKMEYEIKDGIFKSMCKKANENYEKSQKDSSEVKREIELDDLLEQYAVYVEDELKEGKEPKFEPKEWTTKMKIQGVHRLQNGDFSSIMIGTNKDSGVMQRLTQKVIKRDYEKFKSGEIKDWNDIKPSYESKSHRHGNAGYYFTLYESIAEFEKTHYQVSTIPTLESTFDNRLKPYILIIDEINRAGIFLRF